MKHGDKAKAKSAKAASKSSVKSNKAAGASKTAGKTAGANLKPIRQPPPPALKSAKPSGDNGRNKGRVVPDASGFSNPIVASAFKRAIKKFPTAFRRLTD